MALAIREPCPEQEVYFVIIPKLYLRGIYMCKPLIAFLCCVLFVSNRELPADEPERSGKLSFGWANESIVPDRPVAMAGSYDTRITGEVHDPITVTALAMETRDEQGVIDQAVWVSCDLVAIRRKTVENVRKLVAESIPDFNVQKLIISATHTHTAPSLSDTDESDFHPYDFLGSWAYRIPSDRKIIMKPLEYLSYLERQIAVAVVRAWESRSQGELSSALSHASIARNRRAVYFDGSTRMYGDTKDRNFSHLEGTSDDSVDVLFLWRDDQIIGMAITIYCPAQEVEGANHLSADFWFDTRTLLKQKFSQNLFVLPLSGASGDQSPHIQIDKASTEKMLQRRKSSYREEIARRIVNAVEDVVEGARELKTSDVPLVHRVETIKLPVWKVSDERFKEATAIVEAGKDKLDQLSGLDYVNWRVSRTMIGRYAYQQISPFYEAEIHTLRVGDLALATNPFELFTDYAMRIKSRSPASQTSVVQLTSDSPAYLPTERAVQGGGYSGRIDDGMVGPEGGRVLVDETSRMIRSMWPELK